jgi:hypothetical protein
MQLHRSRLRLGAVAALASASVAVLLATRPSLPAASWSRGDDVALAAAWAVALAASLWLFSASAACVLAIGVRRPNLARAFARALPPALRRSVEIAIVASCVAVSAAPAHAANSGPALVLDQPVVRAPRSLALSPDTAGGTATRTAPGTPHTTVAVRTPRSTSPSPVPPPRPAPTTTSIIPRSASRPTRSGAPRPANDTPAPRSPVPSPSARPAARDARVVVRPGDNLWVIARAELIRRTGAYPDDGQVARYWRAVIQANRATLRSGNPSLIFPGEIVALPAVPPVS